MLMTPKFIHVCVNSPDHSCKIQMYLPNAYTISTYMSQKHPNTFAYFCVVLNFLFAHIIIHKHIHVHPTSYDSFSPHTLCSIHQQILLAQVQNISRIYDDFLASPLLKPPPSLIILEYYNSFLIGQYLLSTKLAE